MEFQKMSEYDHVPKPGDLIEISRLGYQHWAIYVGSGYVIHLASSADVHQASACSILSVMTEKAVVRKDALWSVVGSDDWRVNNKYDRRCSPRPANKIVQEAESLLGMELHYSLTSSNCEHFVTKLRYGRARSDQVRDIMVAGAVGLVGVGAVAVLATVISSFLSPSKREEK